MRFVSIAACVLLTSAIDVHASDNSKNPYIGYWVMTSDEDGTPTDTMEVRDDGTYVSHGWTCQMAEVVPYHIHNGDLYATIEVPKKGPISIVFRHRQDGTLSFTSPRTRNNAYYTRAPSNPCPRVEG